MKEIKNKYYMNEKNEKKKINLFFFFFIHNIFETPNLLRI